MSIGKLVNKIIEDGGDASDIRAELEEFNLAPCVMREWANTLRRQAALQVSYLRRHIRKRSGAGTAKGTDFKRIIAVSHTRIPGRRCELHATKGWRSFRLSPA